MPRQPDGSGLSGEFNLVVNAEIKHVGAFEGTFSFVYNVTPACVKAVAIQAAKAVLPAVFRHVIAIAPATDEPVREFICGTAACYLPAVPIRFPAGS